MSPIVEASDVEEAHRLIKEAMQSSAIDPLTGLIDLDLIQTGHSAHSRDVDEAKRNTLRKVINSIDKPTMRWMEVYMHYRESENEVKMFCGVDNSVSFFFKSNAFLIIENFGKRV